MSKHINYNHLIEASPGTEFERIFISHARAWAFQCNLYSVAKRHGIKITTRFIRSKKYPFHATIKYTKIE